MPLYKMKLPISSTTREWMAHCFKQTYDEFKITGKEDASYEQYAQEVEKLISVSIKSQTTRVAKYDSSGHIIPTHLMLNIMLIKR